MDLLKVAFCLSYFQAFFQGAVLAIGTSLATGAKVGLSTLSVAIGSGLIAAVKLRQPSPSQAQSAPKSTQENL